MKYIVSIFMFLAALACVPVVAAQTVADAMQLAEDGETAAAIDMLNEIAEREPKNADVRMELGRLYMATGRDAKAADAFEAARAKGNREAILSLAELANLRYEVDDARKLLEEYRASLKRGRKTVHPDNSGNLEDRIDRTENMLGRVEQIEIIDSLVVDADEFFRHYRLSAESGSLNEPSEVLPETFSAARPTVVYEPESRREMLWAMPDTAGVFRLVSSSALYGNSWERPVPVGDALGEGGDANYPFLMPDGITLYFANDGENSLGGLDIFISRKGDDGFFQPQNLGMPYNSPYDDYMLAVDELTGVGWWATDRNRIPGKVTIYVFVPSELRRNIDPDAPELASRARIDAIRDTWLPTTDRNALIERIVALKSDASQRPVQFRLSVPGRGVYTNYEDFRTPAARQAMHAYMDHLERFNRAKESLADMRAAYAKGNRSSADLIEQAEAQLDAARAELTAMRNDVITLER